MNYQEGINVTVIGIACFIILSVLIIVLQRRYVLFPLFIMTGLMPVGQGFYMAGINFTLLRCLIFLGWVRLILRREICIGKLNAIDKAIIYWIISNVVIFTLREKTFVAFINRIGLAFYVLGLYFFFRSTILNMDDIIRCFRMLAITILPLSIGMLIENISGRNYFSVFGGLSLYSWVRDGHIRSQGPFRHAILAGVYGASMIPFFSTLKFKPIDSKGLALMGAISAFMITLTSYSSGPAMAFLFAIIALAMWSFRERMRFVRWGGIAAILVMSAIMNAPVYYIFARIGGLIGGTGWHRAYIMEQAIHYINEWWLVGTSHTSHWMPYTLPGNPEMADITNQYLLEGVDGGLLTMILFIWIIVVGFKSIGRAIREVEEGSYQQKIIWALGSVLFVHTVTFMSVSYFDQIIVVWYLLLSMISVVINITCNNLHFSNKQSVDKIEMKFA